MWMQWDHNGFRKAAGLFFFFAAVCLSGMMAAGCAPHGKSRQPTAQLAHSSSATFCVIPFFKGRPPERTRQSLRDTFTCPVAELYADEENLAAGADKILSRLVYRAMTRRFGSRVAPLDAVRKVYTGLAADRAGRTMCDLAAQLGERLKTDYVVAGTVWRFREREGYTMTVETPASVGFAVFLLNVESSNIRWMGMFDKTQQPLTDDLLQVVDFFKQGARWLTAEELAKTGVKKVFVGFPE